MTPPRIPFELTKEFQAGYIGETELRRFLLEALPSSSFLVDTRSIKHGSGGPRAESKSSALILPDWEVFGQSGEFWVEAKTKREPTRWIIGSRYDHGIGRHLFEHYRRVQASSKRTCYILILETVGGAVLVSSLDRIDAMKRFHEAPGMDPGGMYFWPRDAMKIVGYRKKYTTGRPPPWEQGSPPPGQLPLLFSSEDPVREELFPGVPILRPEELTDLDRFVVAETTRENWYPDKP